MHVQTAGRRSVAALDTTTATRIGQLLLVVLPVHAIAPRVGFALKPWLVVLAIALVVGRRQLLTAARSLPTSVQVGSGLLVAGAVAGTLARPTTVSARHLVAIVAVLLLMTVWPLVRPPRDATLRALRLGGWLLVVPAVIESMLLLAGRRAGVLLDGVEGLVAPLGDVVYGDILVPHGLHVDSNFLALYAATWVFLLLAHRGPGPMTWSDGCLVGGLLATVAISFSRGGALAVLVASVVWLVTRPGRRVGGRAWVVAGVTAVALIGAIALADAADGVSDLGRSTLKRLDATIAESSSIVGEVGSLGGGVSDEELAAELAEYTEWSPPRSVLWAAYIDGAVDHPVTGIGFGTGSVDFLNYAHNVALEAASGGGVPALLGTLIISLGAAAALARRHPFDARDAAFAGAVTALATGSVLLSTNYSPLTALVLALLVDVQVTEDA